MKEAESGFILERHDIIGGRLTMKSNAVSIRRSTWKNVGWLLIIMLAALPLIVCSGKKPTEETTQPQPAASVAADVQPDAVNLNNVPAAGEASTGDAAAGKALFQKNCTLCHYADKADKKIGPGLKGLLVNKELPASHHPATEANVRTQIETGNATKGMPAFGAKLSKTEIDGLIAYLKTV
jgi:mono/diheme cytochrome c family protein